MPDDLTVKGPLVDALEELKRLLAHSTGWQHWCGVSEAADPAAEAAEHIFLVDAGPPTEGNERGGYSRGDLEAIRPAAFIDFPPPELQDDEVFMAPRIGSGFHAHYGRLNIAIDDDVPAELEGKFAQSKLRFLEYLGRLLIDLEEMSDRGNYLIIGNLQLWNPAVHSSEIEKSGKGEFWSADLLVHWGIKDA